MSVRWGTVEGSPDIEQVLQEVEGLRRAIVTHPLYDQLDCLESVRTFMEHHVFAVWDFMSVVAALRAALCATTPPWFPKSSPAQRRFINEIILAEESDLMEGAPTSHLEAYVLAMDQAGADARPIKSVLAALSGGADLDAALSECTAPVSALAFTRQTWRVIEKGSTAALLGAFAVGRESLIPPMFDQLRKAVDGDRALALLGAYLERHIELDGGEHEPMAYELVTATCRVDPGAWKEFRWGASSALTARRQLWDAISAALY